MNKDMMDSGLINVIKCKCKYYPCILVINRYINSEISLFHCVAFERERCVWLI